jgi:hypothetical protein
MPSSYFTVTEIRHANAAIDGHYFDRGTMRFFRSRVAPGVYAGRLFVTSEQFDESSPRLYSIRMARADGSIDSVGEFQQFNSLRAARAAIRAAVQAGTRVVATVENPNREHFHWQAMLGELTLGFHTTRADAESIVAEFGF